MVLQRTILARAAWALVPLFAGAAALAWSGLGSGASAPASPDRVEELLERVAALEGERDRLRGQVEELADQLAIERAARIEREQEWLRYTRAFSALAPASIEEVPEFGPHLPDVEAPRPAEPDPEWMSPAERARVQRSSEVLTSLRALLFQSGVRSLDLLEVGRVEQGWTGPVVFRSLDERGRLSGSLFAERLRLEGSRAGRSLTVILEDGYESHGGERTPFGGSDAMEGGSGWRITLTDVDPEPWSESLVELFGDLPPEELLDDGRWDLDYLRVQLNQLLREDNENGWLRLRRLGGVRDGVLRDVHVEQLDREGRLQARLFADRLVLAPASSGVVLVLEGGVRMRGQEKTPFLDGRQRIFLPRARRALWEEAGLPGFVDAPEGAAAATRREPSGPGR